MQILGNQQFMDESERKLLSQEFDPDFYLCCNPDVAEKGVDPLEHYFLYGWTEGRDPSPNFDTRYYLEVHRDVEAAAVNPLLHYCLFGKQEKRAVKPSESEYARLAASFDALYYLRNNNDVAEAGISPLCHFVFTGWREGRNPSSQFDVNYYLSTNTDVAEAGINPFLHYLNVGRAEGRAPLRPLADKRTKLEDTYRERALARRLHYPDLSPSHTSISQILDGRGTIISISHDNYLDSFGGVQNVIRDEEKDLTSAGWNYLHLAPAQPHTALVKQSELDRFTFSIQLNGKHIGTINSINLLRSIEGVATKYGAAPVVVHHLMGHIPELVGQIVNKSKCDAPLFWAHDFFATCANYVLLRNGLEFCGAPPVSSNSCTVCAFGRERSQHLDQIRRLILQFRWNLIAPSQVAMDKFGTLSGLKFERRQIWEIAQLRLTKSRQASNNGPLRIAHIGARQIHKGWLSFLDLVSEIGDDSRFKFYQLGIDGGMQLPSLVEHAPVRVTPTDPNAMVQAVERHKIDLAFIWPLWPETFNFTVHEALAGGAFVLTSVESGNVWPAVQKNAPEQGLAFKNIREVVESLREGSVARVLRSAPLRAGEIESGHSNALSMIQSGAG
ncbi:MAG TPA: hypothetical protein PL193_02855 [Xanthobacteraceae bacterium]|nr:hypothetical protein [Xanthobacteraceae bacterium]